LIVQMIMAHLRLDEFDAADFYAGKLKALRGDPATR
jgi:hypothetical protein